MKLSQQLNSSNFSLKEYSNIVGLLIFLSVAILGYFFLFQPISLTLSSSDEQIIVKEQELEQRRKNIEAYKKIKNANPDFPEKVAVLDKISLQKGDTEQLISQLEKIAKDNNTYIPLMDPKPLDQQGGLSMEISAIGYYEDLKSFMRGIEDNRLIINVISLSIAEEQNGRYVFRILLKTGA